tara:strand:- start:825 stop:1469 length:645 start_codon:yes stop_codon:yes gene_type:complete
VKEYPGIDYGFRPQSYWLDRDVLQALLRNIKGAERRKMIKSYYKNGNFQELEESFSKISLSDEERFRLASIHPMFMGGEYLPDYERDETEIARIELNSTMADVISIRACLDEGETIEYSVVDEHDGKFNLWTEWSDKPFSLSELVDFIDRTELEGSSYSGLSLSFNNSNAECMDKEDLVGFTTISSEIYPDLEDHYGKVFTEWAGVEVLEETRQ